VTDPDHPQSEADHADAGPTGLRLAGEAPLARGAVVASLAAVVFGFTFVPQLLGLALAGRSLARREPGGRRGAWIAIGVSLVLTVAWAVVLGIVLKWWASTLT
jgi:Cu/Ag efflux pump CusA